MTRRFIASSQTHMKNIVKTIQLNSETETREFALALADELKPGDVLALVGDLGTGKTALTRYIAEGLGVKERVNSPTFTIVKEYNSGRIPLYHFDVYRLVENNEFEDASDALYNIGADEYFYGRGVSVIEWADLIETELPETAEFIYIEYGKNEGERTYRCTF